MSDPVSTAGDVRAETVSALNPPPGFIELLPIAVYACDAQGRVLWYNRRAAELWGRSPRIGDDAEKFCGSFKLYSLSGAVILREEAPMAHVLRTGEPVHDREAVVERPDGTRTFAMVHIDPIKDAGGTLLGAINCFHDTTELHQTRSRADANTALMRQVLDALPAAVYTTDAKGVVTYFNRAAADLAGREPQAGVDEWCVTWKLYTPDGKPLPHSECPMATALHEDRAVRGVEALAERPDGRFTPFLPFPTPLHDGSGQLIGAVNMLVDISERKDAVARQKTLLAELNHRVKNNMQMLHALVRSAQREATDPEARALLEEAAQRVGAMATAQQVLYDSRNPVAYEISQFVELVCRTVRNVYPREAVLIHECGAGTLPNDTAMPLALILNELIVNAVKHGRRAGAPVHIRIALARENSHWRLSVSDNGPGFRPASPARRGSGLGLVTGLAAQLGGTFHVGEGSCCTVEFPAADDL